MAIAAGLAAQIGVAAESTYGTYVAPTRFLEYNKADLKKKKTSSRAAGSRLGGLLSWGRAAWSPLSPSRVALSLRSPTRAWGCCWPTCWGPQLLRSSRARRLPTSRLTQWATTSASR